MVDLSYINLYKRRLNRYGDDYSSRIEGKREKEFEDFLLKSPNRVDFRLGNEMVAGVLERSKQDQSQTQGYLLTKKEIDIPSGTVVSLLNIRDENQWLIWWLEQIRTSGYNRYVILKLNHKIEWAADEIVHSSWAYFSTPATRLIEDDAVASKGGARVLENNNLHMFVLPYDKTLKRDLYIEATGGNELEAYRATAIDNQATPGISYVTVVPIAQQDDAPVPTPTPTDKTEDFFWLNGGSN